MDVNEGQGLCKMAGNPVASFDLAKGWNFPLAVFYLQVKKKTPGIIPGVFPLFTSM
jgi:hypothetical protein